MKALLFLLSIFVASSVASAEPFLVIVRHAEKAMNDPKDPDLSPAGQARADVLAQILKDSGITAIFTTEFKRTQETAAPTSKSTGVASIIVPARDTAGLVSKLHELKGNALVVGHGDTIPNLTKALGMGPRIEILDKDYDEIFVVGLSAKPQLLRLHYP
jgi:phosphohistidine phosphatase SixA